MCSFTFNLTSTDSKEKTIEVLIFRLFGLNSFALKKFEVPFGVLEVLTFKFTFLFFIIQLCTAAHCIVSPSQFL